MSTPVVRDLAWRFVAGEDLDAAVTVSRRLGTQGIRTTLSFVGTHVRDRQASIAAADRAVESLDRLHAEGLEANISLKLTQVGLDIDEALALEQAHRVVGRAGTVGGFVRIDMEESRYVAATLRILEALRATHGSESVGIVIQSYLRDGHEDLLRLIASGARIRLVKGGYWESAEVVLRDRRAIDGAFERDIAVLLREGTAPAIATHDPTMIDLARRVAAEAGRASTSWELQLLYGVRADLQRSLAAEGHLVRCYVPYGSQWYEYVVGSLRRLPGGTIRRLRDSWASRAPTSRSAIGPAPSDGAGRRGRLAVKRLLDLVVATVALVVLAPVVAAVAAAVRLRSGSPVLFRQVRPGLHGRPFTILKFRTMRAPRPDEVWYLTDDERLTRLGRFLRTTSLDELPELWNVIRGDMSLVGPRPLLMEYLDDYSAEEHRRHDMRPGITGWAVVNGRNTVAFRDRIGLDVWYVEHWSLRLDLRILAMTAGQVLRRQGVTPTESLDLGFPIGPGHDDAAGLGEATEPDTGAG